MIRKHVKIEPDRWYYHCDQLGIMVWQDKLSYNRLALKTPEEIEKLNEKITSTMLWKEYTEKMMISTDYGKMVRNLNGNFVV